MPYIGNTIRAADDYRLIDDISSGFNGSETSFALQVAGSAPVPFPKSPQQVLISVNGVIQEPDPTGSSGFNLVGTNIVFSSAPTNGHAFFGIIYATADYLNAGGNFPAGSLGAPSITFIGDENTGLFRKSGGSVGFVSDATEIANFDSNGITISSGNIIIPDSIIHGGDTDTKIRFSSANRVSVETAGTEKLAILHDEIIINETGGDFDLRIESDNSTNLVRIDAGNDRVGINTSAPEEKFHVNGALISTGSNQTASTSGSNRSIIDLTSGGTRIGHFRGTTSAGSGSLKFFVDSGEKMQLDSSGNCGIGETSPAHKLHISAAENSTIAYFDTALGGRGLKINTFPSGNAASAGVSFEAPAGAAKSAFTFEGASEFMRIDPSGNVGIGTSSPRTELDLSDGQLSFSHRTDYSIRFYNGNGNNWSSINNPQAADGNATNHTELEFRTAVGIAMHMATDGDIGIGTTSPSQHLHIEKNVNGDERVHISNPNTGSSARAALKCQSDSSTLDIMATSAAYSGVSSWGDSAVLTTGSGTSGGLVLNSQASSSAIKFQTQTNERMRINSSGNVGIGATAPAAKLHVSYSYTAPTGGLDSNNALVLSNTNSGSSVGLSLLSATNSVSFINFGDTDDGDIGGLAYFNTDNSMTFRTNAAERMRIDSSGRLLVGTSTQFGDGNDRLMIENTTNGGRIAFGTSAGFSECIIGSVSAYWADNKKVAAISFFGGSDTTNKDDGTIRFATSSANNLAECARFNQNGRLFLNTTANPTTNADGLINGETSVGMDGVNIKHSHGGNCVNLWRANGDGQLIDFFRGNSSQTGVGSITVNSNSTTYNTTSDYRLKENITTLSDAITRLKNLKPSRFNFIHDPTKTVDGFLAHEAMAVVPECGSGTKDAVVTQAMVDSGSYTSKKLGTPLYQGLDYGRITPLLTAALQEAIAKIETLETEVAELKAA